eukprot:9248540-Pyramimonas_sp.AAC.1
MTGGSPAVSPRPVREKVLHMRLGLFGEGRQKAKAQWIWPESPLSRRRRPDDPRALVDDFSALLRPR